MNQDQPRFVWFCRPGVNIHSDTNDTNPFPPATVPIPPEESASGPSSSSDGPEVPAEPPEPSDQPRTSPEDILLTEVEPEIETWRLWTSAESIISR